MGVYILASCESPDSDANQDNKNDEKGGKELEKTKPNARVTEGLASIMFIVLGHVSFILACTL